MPAFHASSIDRFLTLEPMLVVGELTAGGAAASFHQQLHAQTSAWHQQVEILQTALRGIEGALLLEYPIPRRGKRIDTVVLTAGVICVLEFKIGARQHDRAAVAQLEDYCLDLRDFHMESRTRTIVPILVASEAKTTPEPIGEEPDPVKLVWRTNATNLRDCIQKVTRRYGSPLNSPISHVDWDHSDYQPTPTIIEAAQTLYAGNNVAEISRCEAGIDNLTRTTQAALTAIESAREMGSKLICFITGVPGAGKTLAGLSIVHNHGLHEGELGVFLSGNGPLVKVLCEALARDHKSKAGCSLVQARGHVETFIQNVHRFVSEYYEEVHKIPPDRVIIFDEAQRAWDAEQSRRKFKRPFSEPEVMLEIMSRHSGWAVVIALVGVGQEINRGEAGLPEWGRALSERFPDWNVLISDELARTLGDGGSLFSSTGESARLHFDPSLHLRVSVRSFRTESTSLFIDALLKLEPDEARQILAGMDSYPIKLTRSLDSARDWLRARQRGTRRTGLIASSGARRLRAHGLDVTADLDVENWFLNSSDDVRSSHSLEMPATEFGVQGLELDWTGVCWGGDLIPDGINWTYRKFRGTKWQSVRDERTQRYIVNKYRVLLTRAREGMVIWVPPGEVRDPTRPPRLYDRIAAYLADCGIRSLD